MDFIYVAGLILFVFHVKKSAECNNDDIVALPGCNVSLKWTLRNISKAVIVFNIYNSLEKQTAMFSGARNKCRVSDNSSTSCNTNDVDDGLIVLLTIFNVTARQSGNYTLRTNTVLENKRNTSKKLVLIGKPNIMEVRKPILGQPFEMTCNSTHGQEGYIYRWRINGTEITTVHNANSHCFHSLNMTDNFSHVTCRVCWNETARNISSVICEHDVCSIDSDPYTIQVMYGPDNISLSRRESHFYLKEHEIFTIDCFANCYPTYIFWWQGRDSIESGKLNISFESRMSGQYTCYVTNQQANITSKSNPITLHHAEKEDKDKEKDMGEDKDKEEGMGVIGMGLVGVAVLLVVIRFLLVRRWRRNAGNKTDYVELCQACGGETESEVPRKEIEMSNRLLHKEWPNNSREDNCGPNLQEDPYSTIDDDALSDDDHGIDKIIDENSPETRRSTEHVSYDYAYSTEICHVETADVHVTDETYITPISDLARPFEIFQDEETDLLETDHAYLTLIDDHANRIEICQDEEIGMNGTDETYITPIDG